MALFAFVVLVATLTLFDLTDVVVDLDIEIFDKCAVDAIGADRLFGKVVGYIVKKQCLTVVVAVVVMAVEAVVAVDLLFLETLL
jgi:hypothetical protein